MGNMNKVIEELRELVVQKDREATERVEEADRRLKEQLKEKDKLLEEQRNEMNKQKDTAEGGMSFTKEQMREIVDLATRVTAEKTAEKCRGEGAKSIVEYEQRLTKLHKETED